MTAYKSRLYAWMRGQGMAPRGTGYRLILASGAYALYVSFVLPNIKGWNSALIDDFYTISGGVVSLWFGAYVAFFMSRWYDLAVATGTVSGCLTDIAMVVKSYMVQLDSKNLPLRDLAELVERLKIAHAYHVCEVLGTDRTRSVKQIGELFPNTTIKHSGGLVPMLASILSLVTVLSERHRFSDSVKFSLLPAVQQNISTIRARAGECQMILACRYPSIFVKCMYFFLLVHLGYLPVYLSSKVGWVWLSSTLPLLCLLGGSMIITLAIIVERHFKNPFKRNDFKFDHIVASTFSSIEDVVAI